jgi:type II secretory pathway predicted ATPase ExeA
VIWEVLVAMKAIPAIPQEVLALTGARNHTKRRALEASLRRAPAEANEVPMLTTAMLKYFGLERNPVFDEVQGERDIWWSRQHQEERVVLIDAAEGNKFIRVAGRRGAGKSLIAQLVKRELERGREDIVIVEPSAVLSGVLDQAHLMSAVIQAIKRRVEGRDELYVEPQNPTKRALAMRYLLLQQRKAGRRVVLWIDEAHELKAQTFLALKRFLDEVDGMGKRLLGAILIGQNPDAAYNPRARDLSEVTLRLQTYKLQPMHEEIPDYLRFKIGRAGGTVSDVITPAALKAIGRRAPFPLDANVLFAQLVINGFAAKEKPIGREAVEVVEPDYDAAAAAGGDE